ncbi:uncharacterized protein BCR38DRAFT_143902 [Pseudomassariella vexata]|uniref:Uncharacterized protein n=1 Tax=Pseudomassariella vexata TaxID=1141098 RepID=A0A1Y2EC09_9PEZI|nr:uncharacterized protein BCR38DRAFT_143902 [Pseudomassariella vexata]ORY69098.1 hypothetical protein BCR38DRAFT_143902 [Pseudomassariella vexata]
MLSKYILPSFPASLLSNQVLLLSEWAIAVSLAATGLCCYLYVTVTPIDSYSTFIAVPKNFAHQLIHQNFYTGPRDFPILFVRFTAFLRNHSTRNCFHPIVNTETTSGRTMSQNKEQKSQRPKTVSGRFPCKSICW